MSSMRHGAADSFRPPTSGASGVRPASRSGVHSPTLRQAHRAGDGRMGGAVTPGSRGVRGPTAIRGDRARTPQTLRKEVVQPRAGREGKKGFRVSSPMATSPVGVRESSALAGGATSPLPYRGYNMAAKHILDSGTPSPTGASMAARWLQSAADRGNASPVHGEGEWSASHQLKKSRPGVLTVDVGQRRPDVKENLSPDSRSAASKALPVGTNAAKNILETQAATKMQVRTVEVAKKTTQEMQDEMMQLFNEAKKTGCIIEVRSTSKCQTESPDKITLTKNYSRRKTKEEMHDEMMKLFEEAKASGSIIEVRERPDESHLFPPPACASPGPLSSAAMLNRMVHSGPQ